jgi:PAS domain-containing protein
MEKHPNPDRRGLTEKSAFELDPMQRALQENEDWYRDLVEHGRDLLCIHDLAGRLLTVNPSSARALNCAGDARKPRPDRRAQWRSRPPGPVAYDPAIQAQAIRD